MADTVFIPDDGVQMLLGDLLISGSSFDGATVRLFTNNITPSDSSTISSFTEAVWSGYSPVALAVANFGTITISSHIASSPYLVTVSFTRSVSGSAVNNYGWYITNPANTKLIAAARFAAAPLIVTNAGDAIVLTSMQAQTKSFN